MGEVREKTLRELAEPDEDQIPLSKRWLYYLEPGSVTTWGSLKKKFLEKFFPASRANNIRKETYGIRQDFGESLSKYWERLKEFCASFPHHQISDPSLIQYFYSDLLSSGRNTVDVPVGGALTDKIHIEARKLISRMAENSQSFGNRASELDNSLTKECGVCGLVGRPNDKCPEVIEDVNIVRKYDPHGNTYNLGWRDNQNLRWGNDKQKHTQPPPTSSNQGTNLEDIIKALATNTLSFQQEMKQQMTQLTTAISKMDGKGKPPAQLDHANVSVISLRSGKTLDTSTTKEKKVTSKPLPLNSKNESKEEKVETNPSPSNSKNDKSPLNDFTPYIPKPLFPSRLAPKKKETPKEEELLEMFRKVKINLPLLDVIQQVLRYAKFLKELCTNKRKTKERAMEIG
ncbi:retrotransposon gag protein [Cucumis melo var. makuwa]|uniref:Retrotransposon gag protein n=1 Tax=Cucumis melo var. makuwa TaxID=1194695 RepID=A0A5A7V7P8_CUCMM|nr:retrotransposon gag protein [Cucumis melo var. makuwa]TYK13486.1 retrotransposon gag protein [Cucumis melo var. makuwa]